MLTHEATAGAGTREARPPFDVARLREDFPILRQKVHGKPLVYLDNAATAQKPQPVLDAILRFHCEDCANIHRGVHTLSERATRAYEAARATIQRFIGAPETREIVFVHGATSGINLVSASWGRRHVGPGDEVVISAYEHHSNIVPWQMLCEEQGAKLRVIPMNDAGELLLEEYERMLGPRTRIVAVTQMSNALGSIPPLGRMITEAHRRGAVVLVDGAQGVGHLATDVRALDCDFYVFSGHKLCGPTGIGVLYGKAKLLEAMPPYQGGGDMIRSVTFEKTEYSALPYKFEAGTPNIAGAIGLGAAIEYVSRIGLAQIAAYETSLLRHATELLAAIPGVRIVGTARDKASILSWVMQGVHPHDIGTVLDQEGIAIRAGHHCAQPVMDRLGIPATARASFAFYNTLEEVEALARAVRKVVEIFA